MYHITVLLLYYKCAHCFIYRREQCAGIMTTFRQEEYESFLLEGKKVVTEMKVTNDTLNHPDMMTEAEMENATAVFRLELSVKSFTVWLGKILTAACWLLSFITSIQISHHHQDFFFSLGTLQKNMV